MKGGYFVLDCRGYQPTADNTKLVITDEGFKKDLIAAGKSGKPVLFTNFRTGHGPNFGKIVFSNGAVHASVSTALGFDSDATEYIWYYVESADELNLMRRTYKLAN